MLLVFDLDDTIVDTKEAVRRTYESVGVRVPECDANWWGLPAKEWLCDESLHAAKERMYPRYMHLVDELPLADVLRSHNGIIVTGASKPSAMAVIEHFCLESSVTHLHTGCTRTEKVDILSGISHNLVSGGVFFENDQATCNLAREILGKEWQVCSVT